MPTLEQIKQMAEQFPDDPMMRFALGQKMLEEFPDDQEKLTEACDHFAFVEEKQPGHATNSLSYGKALIILKQDEKAKEVLNTGLDKAKKMSDGGHDLIPALEELLKSLD